MSLGPPQSPPPGWYPDPTGRGERFWDGIQWTNEVRRLSARPGVRGSWLVAIVAIGAVLVMIGGSLLTVSLIRGTTASPPPSGTTGGGAASDPAPGSGAPDQPGTQLSVCQVGDPSHRGSDPDDGRLHGGGLVMPKPANWSVADPSRLAFAFDAELIESPAADGWAALGAVRLEEPYGTPEQASATITACLKLLSGGAALNVTNSGYLTVPGAARAHERSGSLQTGTQLREFSVIVADLQSPESLAFYARVIDPDSDERRALSAAEAGLAGA